MTRYSFSIVVSTERVISETPKTNENGLVADVFYSLSFCLFCCSANPAINDVPPGCLCMKGTALLCDELNLTDVPSVSADVSMLYLERNRIQLTDDSLRMLNLTHRL